eukprot:1102174-Ditylum_brightwellii.AAC.1
MKRAGEEQLVHNNNKKALTISLPWPTSKNKYSGNLPRWPPFWGGAFDIRNVMGVPSRHVTPRDI